MKNSSVVTAITSITRKRDVPSTRVTQQNGTPQVSTRALPTTRDGGITEKVVIAVTAVMDRKKLEKSRQEDNSSWVLIVDEGAREQWLGLLGGLVVQERMMRKPERTTFGSGRASVSNTVRALDTTLSGFESRLERLEGGGVCPPRDDVRAVLLKNVVACGPGTTPGSCEGCGRDFRPPVFDVDTFLKLKGGGVPS